MAAWGFEPLVCASLSVHSCFLPPRKEGGGPVLEYCKQRLGRTSKEPGRAHWIQAAVSTALTEAANGSSGHVGAMSLSGAAHSVSCPAQIWVILASGPRAGIAVRYFIHFVFSSPFCRMLLRSKNSKSTAPLTLISMPRCVHHGQDPTLPCVSPCCPLRCGLLPFSLGSPSSPLSCLLRLLQPICFWLV